METPKKESRLEVLLRRQREAEERKKEREAEKARIKAEKKEAERTARRREQRRKQCARRYKRIRTAELKQRKKKGDEWGWHMIVLMKNREYVKRLGASWWKVDAYQKFTDLVKKNHETVKYPKEITLTAKTNRDTTGVMTAPIKYEVLLIQKRSNDETEENERKFRDKLTGKFIENIVTGGNEDYVILDKAEWFVEETFSVYGRHPINDRITYDTILNEFILDGASKENMRQVFTFGAHLVVQYGTDFECVKCKTMEEASRLYTTLEKAIDKKTKKFVIFTGSVDTDSNTARTIANAIETTTGRNAMALSGNGNGEGMMFRLH